jgi:hypothetical protein
VSTVRIVPARHVRPKRAPDGSEVTAQIRFGVFLNGGGHVEFRHPRLVRAALHSGVDIRETSNKLGMRTYVNPQARRARVNPEVDESVE